ncbi:hypothetical protein A176_007627 [Myxococcus hansupus]|uniref:Uncharacterized protein n=1 Tax=Pseudomyxococcus hansupus TaxID=1297742 RepID=A0A0H4XAL2_9BACT|nr:hypothetical protein A176_007627 [Myxococcus hansupus]
MSPCRCPPSRSRRTMRQRPAAPSARRAKRLAPPHTYPCGNLSKSMGRMR